MKYLLAAFIVFVNCKNNSEHPPATIQENKKVYMSNEDSVLKMARANFATCKTIFVDKKNEESTVITSGLILNSTTFLTCYHESSFADKKILERKIFFNFNEKSVPLDSVEVDMEYKYKDGEYDFSKHHYDINDHSTDVLIYKTKHEMPANKIIFGDIREPKQNEIIYSWGMRYSKEGNYAYLSAINSKIVLIFQEIPTSQCLYLVSIGDAAYGFSGSAVYNIKGEVLGLYLFGWDNIPHENIEHWHKTGIIDDTSYKNVQDGYVNGLGLTAAIDIKFVIDKYLKGYL
jgi:hypothetical protein